MEAAFCHFECIFRSIIEFFLQTKKELTLCLWREETYLATPLYLETPREKPLLFLQIDYHR